MILINANNSYKIIPINKMSREFIKTSVNILDFIEYHRNSRMFVFLYWQSLINRDPKTFYPKYPLSKAMMSINNKIIFSIQIIPVRTNQ